MVYQNQAYYFCKNLQGDVIVITDAKGAVIARYSYDAWGVCTITGLTELGATVANKNLFRYRSYIYDADLNLYYLQSRYYDPETGRFINGDEVIFLGITETITSYHLFAYCENNPVNRSDTIGGSFITGVYEVLSYINRMFVGGGLLSYLIEAAVSASNYTYNKQLELKRIIYDQSAGDPAKAKMGYWKGEFNGCSWVATNNALSMVGKYTHASKIIKYFESWGSILNGAFGVMPDAIVDYLRKEKGLQVDWDLLPSKKKIDKNIKNSDASILLYIHSSGMHYIAIRWNTSTKKFEAYNVWSGRCRAFSYNSIQEDLLDSHSYTPVALICIEK